MINSLQINGLLTSCRELTALCSQNGWIDSETLNYDLLEQSEGMIKLKVWFEEIAMEGSGCVAARIACYGHVDIDYSDGIECALITATK
ncbi:MAG: hypothetical protein COB94_009630 [Gammaproteobacteria bacterium]|nr:hypothetical protein [Gammaproteobacteria bacterium]